jgi:hypothetical protein
MSKNSVSFGGAIAASRPAFLFLSCEIFTPTWLTSVVL